MNVPSKFLRSARTLCVVAVLSAGCVVPAMAQSNGASAQLSPQQVAFVRDMLRTSRAQIAKATLAEQRATDPNEKVSAEVTIAQWYAIRAHLAELATAAKIATPVAYTADQQATIARLQNEPSSRVMDTAVRLEAQGRATALAQLREESTSTNPQISAFVRYAQPALMAYDKVNVPGQWTGVIKSGAFAWAPGPPPSREHWTKTIRSGAFSWSTGTQVSDQKWPETIRSGAYAWK